jgi:hypothetical protein
MIRQKMCQIIRHKKGQKMRQKCVKIASKMRKKIRQEIRQIKYHENISRNYGIPIFFSISGSKYFS